LHFKQTDLSPDIQLRHPFKFGYIYIGYDLVFYRGIFIQFCICL